MPRESVARKEIANHERIFAGHLIASNFNQTEAAHLTFPKLTKLSAAAKGSEMLKKVEVQKYLAEELEQIRSVQRFGLLELTEEQRRIAFSNMADFLRIDSEGDPVIDLSKVIDDRVKMAAVQSVEVQETPVFQDGQEVGSRKRIKLKLYDKNVALERLLRIFGAFEGKEPPQVHNHTTYVDARKQTVIVTAADASKAYRDMLEDK